MCVRKGEGGGVGGEKGALCRVMTRSGTVRGTFSGNRQLITQALLKGSRQVGLSRPAPLAVQLCSWSGGGIIIKT